MNPLRRIATTLAAAVVASGLALAAGPIRAAPTFAGPIGTKGSGATANGLVLVDEDRNPMFQRSEPYPPQLRRQPPLDRDGRTSPLVWDGRTSPPGWDGRTSPPAWDGRTSPPAWDGRTSPPAWGRQVPPPAWGRQVPPPAWGRQVPPLAWGRWTPPPHVWRGDDDRRSEPYPGRHDGRFDFRREPGGTRAGGSTRQALPDACMTRSREGRAAYDARCLYRHGYPQ